MAQDLADITFDNVVTVVKIGDKDRDFDSLELHQSLYSHHTFSMTVRFKHDRTSLWRQSPQALFELLGERTVIRMTHRRSGEVTEFFGRVTDIELGGDATSSNGFAVIKGGSPTLLLDRDPSMQAFTDYSLPTLVREVVEQSGVKMELTLNPQYTTPIPYLARYNESSWNFLSRTLRSFGEWFYYDGQKLVVGPPLDEANKKATFNMELKDVRLASRIQPLNRENVDYNYEEHTRYNDAPVGVIGGVNDYMRIARRKSEPFYPQTQIVPTTHAIVEHFDAVNTMSACHSRNYARMSVYTLRSDTCAIRLGERIVVTLPRTFENLDYYDMGRMRVAEITHHAKSDGSYYNIITGFTGGTEAMPEDPAVTVPVAWPEVATVMGNDDPQHLGRVKVQFMWQDVTDENDTSNWIRVQRPDAGSSDAVARDRGFGFIPEKGDQVMVAYERGNPSRPYVSGSLFFGANTNGAAKGNTLKTLRTRSGHTLEFNDDEQGDWGITIKDRNGCVFHIDTKGKNMEITAPETMTLTAKNITISAGEQLSTSSGENTVMHVGADLKQNINGNTELTVGKSQTENIGETATCSVGKDLSVSAGGDISQEGRDITVTAQGGMQQSSQDKLMLKSPKGVDMVK